jgi:hypothetical protein
MSHPIARLPARTLFGRVISRPRPLWITAVIGVLLLSPFVAAFLNGEWAELFRQGHWRVVAPQLTVILCFVIIAPILKRETSSVLQALRPLVVLDDDHFWRMVEETSTVPLGGEILTMGGGLLIGLVVQVRDLLALEGRLDLLQALAGSFMLGLLVWTVYAAMGSARSFYQLHRQPLRVDIFDIGPFAAVGRHSLVVALVFVGGMVLATLLGLGRIDTQAWQSGLSYFVYALVPIAIFFLSVSGTHHLLAEAKSHELHAVEQTNVALRRTLLARLAASEKGSDLASQINALAAYEQRVRATSSWPYDTTMLCTPFLSVIAAAGAAPGREVLPTLLGRQ